jgi:hypothetical protein
MRFQESREPITGGLTYVLRIEDSEIVAAKLEAFDLQLISECGQGSIADKLLGLETLARAIENAA